MQHG
jgi:hypothetical protein